ncbi:hypothetical protein DMN91_006860 [Ooceraea biroi]|uniref:Late endosomal/lysosomal adaptor and MAPK and MTOR activator 5 n=1 Tax=Ooceraea biroi TaxID=2015173 RepID=A0A3L8DJA0_OOCBI|nr:ragulator complex protein LAMTOR5 homolog isoform X1 [Ooceraea biroi]RLU20253.1 hypothetical protein DMN91_006860 [Ooceraea biroi]
MERNLEKTLDDTYNQEGIVGCILTDRAGLCLGVKGNASSDSAGLIAAVADQVAKLEPKSGVPIISLQNDNRFAEVELSPKDSLQPLGSRSASTSNHASRNRIARSRRGPDRAVV